LTNQIKHFAAHDGGQPVCIQHFGL
jgi:hypothetical protein